MKKTNIKSPKPELSDQQILSTKQPFSNILSKFNALPKSHFFSKGFSYGLSGIVLTVAIITYVVIKNNIAKMPKSSANTEIAAKIDSTKTIDFVYKPFKEIEINYEDFALNNDKPQQITTRQGSKINIPANSFVDRNNNPVIDAITLKCREFHNPIEIFLSGIPMTYDSAGVKHAFESAGMIDVIALKGEDTLSLAKGKSLDINLISNNNDTKFNLYYLDTVKQNWIYLGKDKITTRPKDNETVKTAPIAKTLDIAKQTNYVKPIMTSKNKVVFKVEFDVKDFPELSIYQNILFEVDESKTKFNKSWYQINWAKISLKRINANNEYQVSLSKRDSTVNLIARASFSEKEYANAIASYNDANKKPKCKTNIDFSNSQVSEQKDESLTAMLVKDFTNTLTKENECFRQFSMTSMGIWNCDSPFPIPQFAKIYNPKYKDQNGNRINLKRIYIATLEANSVIEFLPQQVAYSKKMTSICFGITEDEKMFIVLPNEFSTFAGIPNSTFKGDVCNPVEGIMKLKKYIQI